MALAVAVHNIVTFHPKHLPAHTLVSGLSVLPVDRPVDACGCDRNSGSFGFDRSSNNKRLEIISCKLPPRKLEPC